MYNTAHNADTSDATVKWTQVRRLVGKRGSLADDLTTRLKTIRRFIVCDRNIGSRLAP